MKSRVSSTTCVVPSREPIARAEVIGRNRRRLVGPEQPVGARIANAVKVADRDVNPVVVVLPAGLDHEHALAGIGTQAIGQQAAGSRQPAVPPPMMM